MKKLSLVLFVSLLFVMIGFVSSDDGGGGGGGQGGPGSGAPAPVPQTGQTTCWNSDGNVIACAGAGQDGDIRAGVEWPSPRFTDNMDGTIRDNLTGLIWLKDANCLGDSTTWQGALDFANTLHTGECGLMDGSFGGDWRLPNVLELASLFDFENINPALPPGHPFMNIQIGFYWSSTTWRGDPFGAFGGDLRAGSVSALPKKIIFMDQVRVFVLPVRADEVDGTMAPAPVPQTGQTTCWDSDENTKVISCAGTGQDGDIQAGVEWPSPRFTDNGDGTIRDNLTGLIWLKDADCFVLRTWAQALTDANGLADGKCGLSDGSVAGEWCLANRNELTSLLDFENVKPALPPGHPFMNIQIGLYWSSTTLASGPKFAWFVGFFDGSVSVLRKTYFFDVLPVRGGL